MSATAFAGGAQAVNLGTSGNFSVLAGTTVTNTGPSVLAADLGLSPGSSITGFPPGVGAGATHVDDPVAQQAKSDLVTAYNETAGAGSTAIVSADLAGNTLVPGVYTSASSLGLSGALTLNAEGNPNAVFIFQAGSTLTTGSGSRILLVGGAQACNVYWQVGSSATIGTTSAFVGNILALTSITATTGATLDGRALARNGAVTLDSNVFVQPTCATSITKSEIVAQEEVAKKQEAVAKKEEEKLRGASPVTGPKKPVVHKPKPVKRHRPKHHKKRPPAGFTG